MLFPGQDTICPRHTPTFSGDVGLELALKSVQVEWNIIKVSLAKTPRCMIISYIPIAVKAATSLCQIERKEEAAIADAYKYSRD